MMRATQLDRLEIAQTICVLRGEGIYLVLAAAATWLLYTLLTAARFFSHLRPSLKSSCSALHLLGLLAPPGVIRHFHVQIRPSSGWSGAVCDGIAQRRYDRQEAAVPCSASGRRSAGLPLTCGSITWDLA